MKRVYLLVELDERGRVVSYQRASDEMICSAATGIPIFPQPQIYAADEAGGTRPPLRMPFSALKTPGGHDESFATEQEEVEEDDVASQSDSDEYNLTAGDRASMSLHADLSTFGRSRRNKPKRITVTDINYEEEEEEIDEGKQEPAVKERPNSAKMFAADVGTRERSSSFSDMSLIRVSASGLQKSPRSFGGHRNLRKAISSAALPVGDRDHADSEDAEEATAEFVPSVSVAPEVLCESVVCSACLRVHNGVQVVVDLCGSCDELFCNSCCTFVTSPTRTRTPFCASCISKGSSPKVSLGSIPKLSHSPKKTKVNQLATKLRSFSWGHRGDSEKEAVPRPLLELLREEQINSFYKFLQGEYSEENIVFYRMIEKLRLVEDDADWYSIAVQIYHTFIKDGAEKQINLTAEERATMEIYFPDIPKDVFDLGQQAIVQLLERDCYARYCVKLQAGEVEGSKKSKGKRKKPREKDSGETQSLVL